MAGTAGPSLRNPRLDQESEVGRDPLLPGRYTAKLLSKEIGGTRADPAPIRSMDGLGPLSLVPASAEKAHLD